MPNTYPDTWNPAYEAIPADTELINLGANRIRDFKVNIRERVAYNHSFAGDGNDGKHTVAMLMVQTVDPTLDTGDGAVYAKGVSGTTELFYEDSAGHVTQLTSGGHSTPFPSGTVMAFFQAAPPVGWTQVTSVNDRLMRVVSGAGGGTGGSWTISGVTVGSHTLVVGEIPAHTHTVTVANVADASSTQTFNQGTSSDNLPNFLAETFTTDGGTGGGGGHSHPLGADGTWRPAYANFCLGSKN